MVAITMPKKKRAFIKITTAENDWIMINAYKTFREFKSEYDNGVWIKNENTLIILDKYIDNGFGDDRIDKYFG